MSTVAPIPLKHPTEPAAHTRVDQAQPASLAPAEALALRTHLEWEATRNAATRTRHELDGAGTRKAGATAEVSLAEAEGRDAQAHADLAGAECAATHLAKAQEAKASLRLILRWTRAELAAADARSKDAWAESQAARAELKIERARIGPTLGHG